MKSRWIKATLCALALAVPGSFAVLAVVWLVRLCLRRKPVTRPRGQSRRLAPSV